MLTQKILLNIEILFHSIILKKTSAPQMSTLLNVSIQPFLFFAYLVCVISEISLICIYLFRQCGVH
jgi:hypothetical protein